MLFTEAGSKPLPRACQNKHTRSVSTKKAISSGNKYTVPPPLSSLSASASPSSLPSSWRSRNTQTLTTTSLSVSPVSPVSISYPIWPPRCYSSTLFRCLDQALTNTSNCSKDCSVVFTLNSSLVGNFASGFSRSRSSEYFVAFAPPLLNRFCPPPPPPPPPPLDCVAAVVVVVVVAVGGIIASPFLRRRRKVLLLLLLGDRFHRWAQNGRRPNHRRCLVVLVFRRL